MLFLFPVVAVGCGTPTLSEGRGPQFDCGHGNTKPLLNSINSIFGSILCKMSFCPALTSCSWALGICVAFICLMAHVATKNQTDWRHFEDSVTFLKPVFRWKCRWNSSWKLSEKCSLHGEVLYATHHAHAKDVEVFLASYQATFLKRLAWCFLWFYNKLELRIPFPIRFLDAKLSC